MAPSATMARRASWSRNSSARVVEAVGMGRIFGSASERGADPDIVILAHVGGERCWTASYGTTVSVAVCTHSPA